MQKERKLTIYVIYTGSGILHDFMNDLGLDTNLDTCTCTCILLNIMTEKLKGLSAWSYFVFVLYCIYGRIWAIPTYRVYQLYVMAVPKSKRTR